MRDHAASDYALGGRRRIQHQRVATRFGKHRHAEGLTLRVLAGGDGRHGGAGLSVHLAATAMGANGGGQV
jgi:hypothetical protein